MNDSIFYKWLYQQFVVRFLIYIHFLYANLFSESYDLSFQILREIL